MTSKCFKYYILITVLFHSMLGCSQNSSIEPFEDINRANIFKNAKSINPTITEKQGALYLDSVLPKDCASGKDCTELIQKAIDANNKIIFPNYLVKINEKGLSIRSNSIIIFQEKSILQIISNDLMRYEILRIHNVENVKIYNANLIGDRENHKGKKGEWGMGIAIRGSREIQIYQPTVESTWGDGIYIGRINGKCSEKITVNNAYINKSRRNGISIVCGDNIIINNAFIARTNGTNPQSGIDIEPNNNDDKIDNIKIINLRTYHNKNNGVIVSLKGLIGEKQKTVSIQIENHSDVGSQHGFALGSSASKTVKDGHAVKGKIQLKNSNYLDNRSRAIEIYKSPYNDIELDIVNPILKKLDKPDTSSTKAYQEKINKYYKN